MRTTKTIMMWLMAALFVGAGVNHFINPDFYLKIMPPYIPLHLPAVYASGVFEIVLGFLLVTPQTRKLAAWGLVALLVAISPVHIHMALNTDLYPNVSPMFIYLRLPLQLVLIAWAYWFTTDNKQ